MAIREYFWPMGDSGTNSSRFMEDSTSSKDSTVVVEILTISTTGLKSNISSHQQKVQSTCYSDPGYYRHYKDFPEYRAQKEEALEACETRYKE